MTHVLEAARGAALATSVVLLGYFLLLNGWYLITSLFAFRALQRYRKRLDTVRVEELLEGGAPPVTLIAPAYNEESTCAESIRALLALEYPAYEIIVVNDGSTDHTLERLTREFALEPSPRAPTADLQTERIRGTYRSTRHPELWVIDKENGRKADALNAGIVYCRTPLFCAMDADTLLERDALLRVVRPFLEDRDTVATGGIVRVVNGCTVSGGRVTDVRLPANMLARFQVLEYLRAFLAGRMGWAALDATLIISGAFGLFRRADVVEVGGFARDTVGEDMELIVRLHRHFREQRRPYRITFIPDPVAWTECPERTGSLARQRNRWQRGLTEVLVRHIRMLLNPRYGRIGLLAFPYYFFLEMLGPAIELAGYVAFVAAAATGAIDALFASAFLMVAIGTGMALSLLAVALEELSFRRYRRVSDLLRLFGVAFIECLGYRQLTSWWRIKGLYAVLRRDKSWGEMERRGFGTTDVTCPSP